MLTLLLLSLLIPQANPLDGENVVAALVMDESRGCHVASRVIQNL